MNRKTYNVCSSKKNIRILTLDKGFFKHKTIQF